MDRREALRAFALIVTITAAPPAAAQATLPVQKQQAVTATSGNPVRIAAIRTRFTTIQGELPTYRKVQRELEGFSLEGGNVEGAFHGDDLRKITARHFGETWRGTEEYFFDGGELFFVFIVHEVYDEEVPGKVDARIEHRLYYDRGQLIRRVRTVYPAGYPHDLSARDPDLEEIAEYAEQFAACVRATGTAPAACQGDDVGGS